MDKQDLHDTRILQKGISLGITQAHKEEEEWLLRFFKKEIAYSVPVWVTEEMRLRLSKLKSGEQKK